MRQSTTRILLTDTDAIVNDVVYHNINVIMLIGIDIEARFNLLHSFINRRSYYKSIPMSNII